MSHDDQLRHQSHRHQTLKEAHPPDQRHPPPHNQPSKAPHHSHKGIRLIKHPTTPLTWLIGVICTVLWVVIIFGGLAVVIVYLVFRPRSPRFEISSATLNTAYIDMGSLLNADLTFLANISNPNKKIDISFDIFEVDLYYRTTLIATTAVDPFSEMRLEARLGNFHMVSSQVALHTGEMEQLKIDLANSSISLDVKGSFRARSSLGRNFLHFKYWLHGRCSIVVSSPPGGSLLSSKCITKR